jgi:hypothetical protein
MSGDLRRRSSGWEVTVTARAGLFLTIVGLTAISASAGVAASASVVYATVTPGASITLTTATGDKVVRLKAGRYRIVVLDKSRRQNFRLQGPGIERETGLSYVGSQTWTLRLTRGRYQYSGQARSKHITRFFVVF